MAKYVADLHVIRMRAGGGTGTFFMPFGLERPALIIHSQGGSWRVEWNKPVRSAHDLAAGAKLILFDGIDEPLLLIPLERVRKAPTGQLLAASTSWALIALENETEGKGAISEFVRWRSGLSAQALVSREIAEFEKWRAKPAVHFTNEKERHLWRQSETMLRIAQSREPNRRADMGTVSSSLPYPTSIQPPGSATWPGRPWRWPRWGIVWRRAQPSSPISMRGPQAKCARK